MDETIFPNGRHRNKTYLQVYENDKEYCQMVLRGEKSRFIPEDFLQYLKNKNTKPSGNIGGVQQKKSNAEYFLEALDEEMKTEFKNIIGQRDNEIRFEQVHPPCCDLPPNTFLGIFYKFFIQKNISNIANTNCSSEYIHSCTTVFPFPVSDKLSMADFDDGGILSIIKNDETFTNEIQMFLSKHFGPIDLFSIMETFFANVLNCRANVVDERTIWNVLRTANLTEMLTEAKKMSSENVTLEAERRNDYLANFPRLNCRGVGKFQDMYRHFKNICELYQKPCEISSDKYDYNYLRNLPEINFYELYSLLDVEIFNGQPSVYLHRLKKYLFFFVNALNNESKPVFFIDDILFQNLLNYKTFKEPCRNINVLDLKYELSLLSLAYLRKFRDPRIRNRYAPNEDNLVFAKRHLDSFSDLRGVSVGRHIRTELLDVQVKISTNEMVMDVRYKRASCNKIEDFWTLVLQGALIDENVQRLVIYNAYLGQETSIRMPDKQRVVEFIRRHNGNDFSKEWAPQEFLTGGFEDLYEGDVANWDSKIGFNF